MSLAIVVTKDEETGKKLVEKGFEFKQTSQKGNHIFVKNNSKNISSIVSTLPKAKLITNDTLQEIFSQNAGWGGEDFTIPDDIDNELSALMASLGVKGGARKGRKTRSKFKGKGKKRGISRRR
jgi:hypothetical protein